ncbi:stage II sporulation protein M [Catenovulum agarivorans]|uniref:stage II sporulation protein M n=1 Tax=Catenovulum agarivorans TaxID=1172192 RepID=UPI00036FA1D2|nr:stage II sporulation protein M [Catenovulum agarivorans]
MKQNQFVKLHKQRWTEFETMCTESPAPANFPLEYRRICSDLALAKTRHYSPALVANLNDLVKLGQSVLYSGESIGFTRIWSIFKSEFPKALYTCRNFIWAALTAFWGLSLIAFFWIQNSPDAIYHFVSPDQLNDIADMYNPAGAVQTDKRTMDADVLMFGVYIYNNIGIAFQMFGAGALFCIGALIPLLFNSFYFGAISAYIVELGYNEPFFSFVITHGSFELTAIIIAGAAGCKLGFDLLSPGKYSRAYIMKKTGLEVLPLIVGAFVMLVVAAFIEAFWSPLNIPSVYKYSVGSILWILISYKLYTGTRYGT